MKHKSVASLATFAAISLAVAVQVPGQSLGSHNHTSHNRAGEGFELGNFTAQCVCPGDSASAQTVMVPNTHNPNGGFAVQLTVTDPSCCVDTFASTGIENITTANHLILGRGLQFDLTDVTPGSDPKFDVFIRYVDGNHVTRQAVLTFGNGRLKRLSGHGNTVQVVTQGLISPVWPLLEVDFELNGVGDSACDSVRRMVNVSNVVVNSMTIPYEVNGNNIENESSFCSNGC